MLKTYNSALHLSKQTYFNTLITSLSNNPKRLFDTFQSLLNPRAQAPTTDLRADNLANYFKEKIDHIRQEIISQSLHTMHCPPSPTASSSLSDFEPVTEEEYHLYADDTQLYTSSPDLTPALLENTSDCLTAVSSIMSSLYLKLNLSKTELLVFSPSTNLPLPDIAISVCGSTITPKQHARCLGVILDSDLSFTPHIRSLARSSYLHLKNISRIRPFLTFDSAKTLTVSLIHSRLDYCNSLLIGLPLTKLSPLQSVLNAAARIIFLTNRYTDASTLCQSLHWLPIHSRIQYKTTTLIHKALHGSAPPYISSLVSVYHPTRALRSADDLRWRQMAGALGLRPPCSSAGGQEEQQEDPGTQDLADAILKKSSIMATIALYSRSPQRVTEPQLLVVTKDFNLKIGPVPKAYLDDLMQERRIGCGNWNQYEALFFHPNGTLYAVCKDDSFVKGNPPTAPGNWLASTTKVGTGGWLRLTHFMAFSPDGNLWSVDKNDGKIYKKSPPVHENDNYVFLELFTAGPWLFDNSSNNSFHSSV
ncbi:unnamed protein product [Ranitomeya imitator]|uniref:Tachylectin 2 domain-containing protein n=1 Tax=Ranitomeya imitator TaxID=111125 RepID=A0ABN9KV07_9NEOB|nr:unnamed protein product [Ranitomeya imitator]